MRGGLGGTRVRSAFVDDATTPELVTESSDAEDRQSQFSDMHPRRRRVVRSHHHHHHRRNSISQLTAASSLVGPAPTSPYQHSFSEITGARHPSTSATSVRGWLAVHALPGVDYVAVLLRFVRLDVTAVDLGSLLHVCIGAAQLAQAVAANTAVPDASQNPLTVPGTTGNVEDVLPMQRKDDDLSDSFTVRVMVFELRTLGAVLLRCCPALAELSASAPSLAQMLVELTSSNVATVVDSFPVVFRELMASVAYPSAPDTEASDSNLHSATLSPISPTTVPTSAEAMPPARLLPQGMRLVSTTVPVRPKATSAVCVLVGCLVMGLAVTTCVLLVVYAHYLPLLCAVPIGLLHAAAMVLCWEASMPLVAHMLAAVASAAMSLTYAVDVLVYPAEAVIDFPLSLVGCAAAQYYACMMCDVFTLRVRGSVFRSSYLAYDLGMHEDDDDSVASSREEDDATSQEHRQRRPSATDHVFSVSHVQAALVYVACPVVIGACIVGGYIARLAGEAAFREVAYVVGEVGVMVFLLVAFLAYMQSAQQRRLAAEDVYQLVLGMIRASMEDGGPPDGVGGPSLNPPPAAQPSSSKVQLIPGAPPIQLPPAAVEVGPTVGRIGSAATSVGQRPGRGGVGDELDTSSSIMNLLHDYDTPRGKSPGRNLRVPLPRTGSDSKDSVSSPLQRRDDASTSQQIALAGKWIAPHGEMLLNVAILGNNNSFNSRMVAAPGGGSNNLQTVAMWRSPLDEVHLSTIVIGVDGKGDIVLWNWFAEDLTHFHSTDMIGRSILSILPSSEFHAEMFSKITMTMSDRNPSLMKCSIVSRRVGKPTIDVALQAYPAKLPNGATVGVIFAGTPIRHETLQEVGNQLLELHSAMPEGTYRSQLYRSLLLLQGELPKSTVEVNLPQLLGRIFSAQFQRRAILLEVLPSFPPTLTLDVDALQLVVLEMLQHYLRVGCVLVRLGHDDLAQAITIKISVEAPPPVGSSASRVTRGALLPLDDAPLVVPKWKPSVTAAQAARKMNCVIRTDGVAEANCSLTVVGAVAAQHAVEVREVDSVRCNVAIYDSEALSSILIRNAVWERKHMLFFIEDASKLSVALDGVDILFARFPRALVQQIVTELKQERPLLELIVIVDNDTSDRKLLAGKKLPCLIMEDPIITSEVHDMLTTKVGTIAERRKREDKVSDIRKLFTQSKSCPWVRGQLLGRGANATVYEATNTITSGKMAVRSIRINSEDPEELKAMMEGLIQEVKLMSKFEHKNIINYLSLERDEGVINVFMEYAPGGSIRSVLDKKGRVPIEQVAVWLRDILEGLTYLHNEGIMHLDIKSANVLLAADGTCKISDFGTARPTMPPGVQGKDGAAMQQANASFASARRSSITTNTTKAGSQESDASGTLHFMAPEMLNGGHIDWRADIWSLGCMTMEMLTGKLPFSQMGALAIVGYISSLQVGEEVALPKEIQDPDAIGFLKACLSVDPAGRPNGRTLQNHPFVVKQSARHVTMTRGGIGGGGKVVRASMNPHVGVSQSSSDEDSERRESCFSAWSAQDQCLDRRRTLASDW